ncbi:MAG: response regulator transcription factor [Tissierellia bacterium]|nr:response regulator transcription factor [Tissierellia bacterium]
MREIFVVEDNKSIREMVMYALDAAGYKTSGFEEGEALFAALENKIPCLVLLDIMLPGKDGIGLLKKIRQTEKYKTLPVILLTAKSSELDRITGLDLGADDYITKPFSVMEMVSRVKALLRRVSAPEESGKKVSVGPLSLNPQRRSAQLEGEVITLTFKEFELLHYLMLNEGIVLSRDRLLEQVWGFDYDGETRTVDMHIRSLRQKLGDGGEMIKTLRNVGYCIRG